MIGENFKSFNRTKDTKFTDLIQQAKGDFTDYANMKTVSEEDFQWEVFHKLEAIVERLDYLIYCHNYNNELRRTWK